MKTVGDVAGWIILAGYVAGFLSTYRRFYLALTTPNDPRPVSGALLLAAVWPISLAALRSANRYFERLEREERTP